MDPGGSEDPPVPPPRGRRTAPRNLKHRVVHNRGLTSMPTTRNADGEEIRYEQDVDDHEDEEIIENDLKDPTEFLLVDRYDRAIIMPYGDDLQPQNSASKAINYAIKSKYQRPYLDWTEVKKDDAGWNQFWTSFREKCTWMKYYEGAIMRIFNRKCSKRLSALLSIARTVSDANKPRPSWIGENTWPELRLKWGEPDYKSKCVKAKQNRASEKGGSTHTGGSVSAATLRIRFERDNGRPPTLIEMSELLHRRGDGSWTSERAAEVWRLTNQYIADFDAYQDTLVPSERAPEDVRAQIILQAFVDFAGGKNRGRHFGAGSTSSFVQRTPAGYIDTGSSSYNSAGSSTGRSARPPPVQRSSEDQAAIEARIRAQVMAEMDSLVQRRVNEALAAVQQQSQQPPPAPHHAPASHHERPTSDHAPPAAYNYNHPQFNMQNAQPFSSQHDVQPSSSHYNVNIAQSSRFHYYAGQPSSSQHYGGQPSSLHAPQEEYYRPGPIDLNQSATDRINLDEIENILDVNDYSFQQLMQGPDDFYVQSFDPNPHLGRGGRGGNNQSGRSGRRGNQGGASRGERGQRGGQRGRSYYDD